MVLEVLLGDAPPAVVDRDSVAAEPQAFHQADERTALALERVGDVGAVAQHAQPVEPMSLDPDERVAAAHLVGSARKHVDVDVMCRSGCGERGGGKQCGGRDESPSSHAPTLHAGRRRLRRRPALPGSTDHRGCLGAVGAAGVDRPSILRVDPFGARPIGIRR